MLLLMMGGGFGCVANEATGRSQLALIGRDHANAIGEQSKHEFRQSYGGDVDSAGVRAYVNKIGQELAKHVREQEIRDLNWEFFVVDSSVVNAFALPGGKVYMSRGLMEKMSTEAQLAGVLGHEIGHVAAEHSRERMSQSAAIQMGTAAVLLGASVSDEDWMKVVGVGAQAGGSLYLLKFNRDQEAESDELGLRYMTALNYDPSELIQVMKVLKEASGGGGGFDFFATHPDPDARIAQIKEIIAARQWGKGEWKKGKQLYKKNVLVPLSKLGPARHPKADG